MISVLGIIADELHHLGVPYEYMRWTSDVKYPYFVGEYSETITNTEDGYKEGTLIITGTTKDSWLGLEQIRARIEHHFPSVCGLRKSTDEGVVVIYYGNSFPVDTGGADLKRIQINLQVKEWKGMN
jgi:hypothetical protein